MNQSPQATHLKAIPLIALTLLFTACQPTSAPTQAAQSGSIANVHVVTAEPTETCVDSETFPLPNCGGTSELHQTLGSNASIFKSVTVGTKATAEGAGEVAIPETAKLQLKLAVEAAYQETYETANSRLDTIDMRAAAGTHVVYDIGWYEQTFSSIVEYSENNQVFKAPYTYKLRIPKIDNSYQNSCDGGSAGNNGQPNTQPAPQSTSVQSPTSVPLSSNQGSDPLREHKTTPIVGTGVLAQGTHSDGMAPISASEITSHLNIQRIRLEENPDGCAIAFLDADKIWFGSSVKTNLTINDVVVGTINGPTGKHGYIFNATVHSGDKVCVTYFEPSGCQIVFGPDIYYH
jgi:hypothetical protein